MSIMGARLGKLLAEQRRDGEAFDEVLVLSNRALGSGDLAEAERYGRMADDLMAKIRVRSRLMADLLDEREQALGLSAV